MAEKKIVTLGVRMDEPMLLKLKALAETDGVTESELVRTLISNLISDRREHYMRLHYIFGDELAGVEANDVQQRTTSTAMAEVEK